MRTIIISIGILLIHTLSVWADEIHEAVKNNDMENVKRLIAKDPQVVTARDQYQMTPLHWAASKNNLVLAELLVNAGADVNARGNSQGTPLHESISNKWAGSPQNVMEMVSFLIQNGAEVNAADKFMWTPLHIAAMSNYKEVVEYLIEHGAKINATYEHEADIVGVFESGVMVKMTSLDVAIWYGRTTIADILRQHGGVEIVEIHRYSGKPSFEYILKHYNNATSYVDRVRAMYAFAEGKHQEALSIFNDLLRSGEWENYIPSVCAYIHSVRYTESLEILASAYIAHSFGCDPFCDPCDSSCKWCFPHAERRPILVTLIALAEEQHQPLMLDVVRASIENEVVELSKWFVYHPSEEAEAFIQALLNKFVKRRYTMNMLYTLALARMGDHDVLTWAEDYLRKHVSPTFPALQVVAESPLPTAESLAKGMIHGDDATSVELLIHAYSHPYNVNVKKWIYFEDIIRLHKKNKPIVTLLESKLSYMAENGEKKAQELLMKLKESSTGK